MDEDTIVTGEGQCELVESRNSSHKLIEENQEHNVISSENSLRSSLSHEMKMMADCVNENAVSATDVLKVQWDRVETEFSEETQKFSVEGLHRAQTLFSVHPSAPAENLPSISSCCLGQSVLLCVDTLLHIFDNDEHIAAIELDAMAEQMAILDLKSRTIVLAKQNGEIEIMNMSGASLFNYPLTSVTRNGVENESNLTFLFLEATANALCLLTNNLTLFVLKKKSDSEKENGNRGEEQTGDAEVREEGTVEMSEEEVVQKENDKNDLGNPLQNLLDISHFSLAEHEDIDEVSALVIFEDVVVFAAGAQGALYRLDLCDGSLYRLAVSSPSGRILKMLASGDRRYIILLCENGCVAIMCSRTFLIVDFIMDRAFTDIGFSQMSENDGAVLKVFLAGYHRTTNKIGLYTLPTLDEEYSVELGGRISLVKQCSPREELVVIQMSDDLSNITVKSINESSPQTKLDCLLLKQKYEEAEQLAKLFKLSVRDVYLEEFYFLLNQLGQSDQNQIESDAFTRLIELYHKLGNPIEVYNAVINSLPANLDHTMQLLDLLASDLQQNHNGNGSSSQLADVVLSQYKLTTFKLIENEHRFELWSVFLRTATLNLVVESLQHNQNSRALTIWTRHRDRICGNADLSAIKGFINVLPSMIDEMKRWLVEGRLLAYLISNFPDAVDDLISRIVETAVVAEVREPTSWPLSSLSLINTVQSEFDAVLLTKSNHAVALPWVINAMKMFQGLRSKTSPVHKMATLRRDILFLIELRQKYNVHLALNELSALSEKDLMFYVMNSLSSEMEIHNFIQCTLKDTCLKKGLDLNDMLLEYIVHLRRHGEGSNSPDWELKACRVFKLLAIPEFMSKAALTIVEAAAIPWKQCVHEVYDIAVGMDFLHKEKLERLKRDIPLKLLLRKYGIPPTDLDEEDIVTFLMNAGEPLSEMLRVAEEIGWSRGGILVEFLVKYCEEEDADKVEQFLKDFHEEMTDTVVWARLQFIADMINPRSKHSALIRYALTCCSDTVPSLPAIQVESAAQILSQLQGQTAEEVFCELFLYSHDRRCHVDTILHDLLVEAVTTANPKVPLIAACFLQPEINERVCLVAIQYLLSKYPVTRISNILEEMLAKCNIEDAGYSLYELWISTLVHFNLTTTNDPFECWKFSPDISRQQVALPSTVVSNVDTLINNVFDEDAREMSFDDWLKKLLTSLRQACDELHRISAIQLVYELSTCIKHTLSFFDVKEPIVNKMVVDSAKTFIRDHISSKYSDLFFTAHVLAELGPDILLPYFQSMLAHSTSNTAMVIKLASVGLLVSDMHHIPGKTQLMVTLKLSEWCLRLADYRIDVSKIVKEGFNQRNADEVAEKLTQSTNLNIDLLKQFAQDFSLGSLSVHASRLFQHLIVSAVDEVHQGNTQSVYLDLLPKADNVLGLLTPEEALAALHAALRQIDDYCYELLQYIYEKLESLGRDQQKELLLLLFLKGYCRKSKISTKETLQWTMLHPEYCTLPDMAAKRIPLRVIMEKPEVVLTAELNANNIDDWISICHLIRGLNPDDMRVLALTNSVKQYKQRASAVTCDEKLVEFFMKLIDDMTDEKKALSSALHMFNDIPKGKTKVRIAQELWRYANECTPSMGKIAQTFYSQYRALGCEVILRENSFEESGLLKRCTDPNDLVATLLGNKLNSNLTLDVARVLPIIEQTAELTNAKTNDFLVHFIGKWLNDNQINENQSDVTETFNFNQIVNGGGSSYNNETFHLDDVIRVVRLLVALPEDTAVQLINHILALQNSTHTLAIDQQLRTNLAVLGAFDEDTASSLLGSPSKEIVRQCNQLMYSGRIQRHGVSLNTFLSSEDLVRKVVGQLVQRNQRDALILAFHIFRDFGLSDERTLAVLVDGVAGRPDILEEAVLFLQRFRSVFGQPEFVQCWTRIAVVHAPRT